MAAQRDDQDPRRPRLLQPPPYAGPCPYSNICEQCDNFTPGTEFQPVLADQLADVRLLRDDAHQRGWNDDTTRHDNVIASLERHLHTLDKRAAHDPTT